MFVDQYGPFVSWFLPQRKVDIRLRCIIINCPVVGGVTIMYNFYSVIFNHIVPECSIRLHMSQCFRSYAMGIDVPIKDTVSVPDESLPFEFSRQVLSRLCVLCLPSLDDHCCPLTSPPDTSSNDILVRTAAYISPLVNHQSAPSLS
jgi:hypothetical protein